MVGILWKNIKKPNELTRLYRKSWKAFKEFTSIENEQSILTFIKYIDNLNIALDGKMNFDAQGIIKDLENEYNVCYKTWFNQKMNEILKLDLTNINDFDETFDSFANRQNLDLSFDEKGINIKMVNQMNLINIIKVSDKKKILKLGLISFMVFKKLKKLEDRLK